MKQGNPASTEAARCDCQPRGSRKRSSILIPELREAAVYYFGRSYSPDPTLMPLVIQAFEQFGLDAFEIYSFLDDLVQTDESVAWLIQQIERIDPVADERSRDFVTGCVAALRHAHAAVLKPHYATIERMQRLDGNSKKIVAQRIVIELSPSAGRSMAGFGGVL